MSESRRIIRELFQVIGDELAYSGEVKLLGLGKLRIVRRSPEAWNPKTKSMICRKQVNGLMFFPVKELKEKING